MMEVALIMEAESTSETSENFFQTTRRNNAEDSNLQVYASLSLLKSNFIDSPQNASEANDSFGNRVIDKPRIL
jgi:hypothetical protein